MARAAPTSIDLARLTLDLVKVPSESRKEAALARHVAAYLLPILGAPRWQNETCLVYGGRSAPGREVVALVGHLDTVPDVPGLIPRIEGGMVHGRGAADLKSGMALMLALAEAIRPGEGRADLALVFYGCEEIALSENQLGPLLDACPWLAEEVTLAIAVEPTDNFVEVGCNGTIHAEVKSIGKRAHSARPWMGKNAIHMSAELVARVAAVPERPVDLDGLLYREVMGVTRINGGGARNVIPGECMMNVNFRFAPDRELDEAIAFLKSLFADDVQVEIVDAAPAGKVCMDNPLVRRLIASAGKGVRAKQGWTDVAQLTARGIDAVNFGPGNPEKAHQDDEFVPIANLMPAYEALASLLLDNGGGDRRSRE